MEATFVNSSLKPKSQLRVSCLPNAEVEPNKYVVG
jgi:hypothetical protein